MTRLRGHFNGQVVVLDEPAPPELAENTPVEVVLPSERLRALQQLQAFWKELSERPLPHGFQPPTTRWKREDLYERRR